MTNKNLLDNPKRIVLSMESEKNKEEEKKTDFDKILAHYRMAVLKQSSAKTEEKQPSTVEKTPIAEKPIKIEAPLPLTQKPVSQEIVTSEEAEKYLEWVKVVEGAVQNCLSQSRGTINSIYVLLPDGITCLGFGSRIDLDEDILAAFIGEQFELFESYSSILQIGEIEEIEYLGKQGVILMKSGASKLRLMALLNDKSYVRLAKIYLERVLKSVPRLE